MTLCVCAYSLSAFLLRPLKMRTIVSGSLGAAMCTAHYASSCYLSLLSQESDGGGAREAAVAGPTLPVASHLTFLTTRSP